MKTTGELGQREATYCYNCERDVNVNLEEETRFLNYGNVEFVLENVMTARCELCGETLDYNGLEEELTERLEKLYIEHTKPISSEEIILIRKKYDITQKDMSKLLELGEKTITRYENGFVPSKVISDRIKQLNNFDIFIKLFNEKKHLLDDERIFKIESGLTKVYNGGKRFDLVKANELMFTIIKKIGLTGKTRLNKIMFYCDFGYFKENGISITGGEYIHFPNGPVFKAYYKYFENNPMLKIDYDTELFDIKFEATMASLSNNEVEYINVILEKVKEFTTNDLVDFSHQEDAWLNTELNDKIPYSYAKTLKHFV